VPEDSKVLGIIQGSPRDRPDGSQGCHRAVTDQSECHDVVQLWSGISPIRRYETWPTHAGSQSLLARARCLALVSLQNQFTYGTPGDLL